MRLRKLVREKKVQRTDSDWCDKDLQPRNAPIYMKTRPIRAGWRWRSAKAEGQSGDFVLLAECNPSRANWKAMLILVTDPGASVVARFEDHGSHPGLHIHAHCERGGLEPGVSSIDDLPRIPPAHQHHRRTTAWTETGFWEAARRFFRIEEPKGPLL